MHQLQHDGFLAFGVMFQHRGRTEEVFVAASKFLRIWTNDLGGVRAVLARHGIAEVPELEFIDEYPMVSESLRTEAGNASWPVVVQALREAFDRLPRRHAPSSD